MTQSWDAIVIGGGPAGVSAAIRLAETGHSCLLLEREAFPRDRPGETLHPGIEPLLRQIGIWDAVVALAGNRPMGIQVSTPDGLKFERYGEDAQGNWRGVNIPRASLDCLLLKEARRVSVVVEQRHVRGLCVIDGHVRGVVTAEGELSARVVIDCAGGSHRLARVLRLPIERRSPLLIAKYGYVKGVAQVAADEPHFAFDQAGWTWLTRVDSNLTHWARLDVLRGVEDLRSRRSKGRPSSVAELPAVGATRGADVTWRMVSQPAGRGYFIAGDAAFVVDPAASDGVIRSILSGRLAGHLAAQVLDRVVAEDHAVSGYSAWVRDQFERCVFKLGDTYSAAFPGWLTTPA
jgi:flavin-dependent dehydrogenase